MSETRWTKALAPQPCEAMPGTSWHFTFENCRQAAKAAKVSSLREIQRRLAELDLEAIEAALPHGLHNADGTGWAAGANAIPLPIYEIGASLADALNRRIWGESLRDVQNEAADASDEEWRGDVL